MPEFSHGHPDLNVALLQPFEVIPQVLQLTVGYHYWPTDLLLPIYPWRLTQVIYSATSPCVTRYARFRPLPLERKPFM